MVKKAPKGNDKEGGKDLTPTRYAKATLTRGDDGLIKLLYVDLSTGEEIPYNEISNYQIVDANNTASTLNVGQPVKKKKKKKGETEVPKGVVHKPEPDGHSGASNKFEAFLGVQPSTNKVGTSPKSSEDTKDKVLEASDPVEAPTSFNGVRPSLDDVAEKYAKEEQSSLGFNNNTNKGLAEQRAGTKRSWTDEDRRAVAVTLAGELDLNQTDLETEEGQKEVQAIISTIENRALKNGTSIAEEALRSNDQGIHQYSAFNSDNEARTVANFKSNPSLYKGLATAYESNPYSRMPDVTNYYNPAAVTKIPSWDDDLTNVVTYGPHKFGALEEWNPHIDSPTPMETLQGPETISNITGPNLAWYKAASDFKSTPVDSVNPNVEYPLADYMPNISTTPWGEYGRNLGFSPNPKGLPPTQVSTQDYDPRTGQLSPHFVDTTNAPNRDQSQLVGPIPQALRNEADSIKNFPGYNFLGTRGIENRMNNGSLMPSTPLGFGDYFNPERLGNPNEGSEMTPEEKYSAVTNSLPQIAGSPSFNTLSTPPGFASNGNSYVTSRPESDMTQDRGPSSFSGPSGGSSADGDTSSGRPSSGPHEVGGYSDGGFHGSTPSYTAPTPTYSDHGFHSTPSNTSTSNSSKAIAEIFASGKNPNEVNKDAPTSSNNSYGFASSGGGGGW